VTTIFPTTNSRRRGGKGLKTVIVAISHFLSPLSRRKEREEKEGGRGHHTYIYNRLNQVTRETKKKESCPTFSAELNHRGGKKKKEGKGEERDPFSHFSSGRKRTFYQSSRLKDRKRGSDLFVVNLKEQRK